VTFCAGGKKGRIWRSSGTKNAIFQSAIDGIIQDVSDLDRFSIQTVPFDLIGKPNFLGNGDPIFFKSFLLDIIESPEEKANLLIILLELGLPLANPPKILAKETQEVTYIGLIDALSCLGFDKDAVDGKPKSDLR
jgi:hypothetical protein